MSVECESRVWSVAPQRDADLIVLLALANRADEEGVCWPGIEWIAQKARRQPRQTQRIIARLEQAGALYIHRGSGRGHTSLYLVTTGLDSGQLTTTLRKRFSLPHLEAASIATRLLDLAAAHIASQAPIAAEGSEVGAPEKGVICEPSAPERVSLRDQKGVICEPSAPERVSPRDQKGVIAMTPETLETLRMNDRRQDAAARARAAAPPPPAAAAAGSLHSRARSPTTKARDHPAVAVYRDLTGRLPTGQQCQLIASQLGADYDHTLWESTLLLWIGAGWKLNRLDQILDRYRKTADGQVALPAATRPPPSLPATPYVPPTPNEILTARNQPPIDLDT